MENSFGFCFAILILLGAAETCCGGRTGPTELGLGGWGLGLGGARRLAWNWAAIFSHTFNENSKLMKV